MTVVCARVSVLSVSGQDLFTIAPRITGCPPYERYLEHFGQTVTVAEFHANATRTPLTALRHDVDYSIDVALALGALEYRRGIRSAWFMLHTAAYWSDERFLDKCLQLQDWGHEVGLHSNVLAEWFRGNIDDVSGELSRLLGHLRGVGINVRGVAAHGDPLCYEVGFTNYWLYSDVRPENPAVAECGVTAEGSKRGSDGRYIDYPKNSDSLVRPDGARFDFWSLRLADFGLAYEGSRVNLDAYFSDSGGAWKRSADPISTEFGKNRSLVLMHPLYWRPPQRHYYFLSTARSGSKWLAHFLNEATSVTARHEFTLNHRLQKDGIRAQKNTGAGFTNLLADHEKAVSLIYEAREWSESLLTDYAEVNVYLDHFLNELKQFDNTTLVHLHRDPAEVVRSLLQRRWYEVPFDDRHPPVDIQDWESLSQLEKICHYVADTDARLDSACSHTLPFERMVVDVGYLTSFLEGLGISVYPRLAARVFGERVNQTVRFDVPPLSQWESADKETFARIIAGYSRGRWRQNADRLHRFVTLARSRVRQTAEQFGIVAVRGQEVLADVHLDRHVPRVTLKNVNVTSVDDAQIFSFPRGKNAHVLLGGGIWHRVDPITVEKTSTDPHTGGWTCKRNSILTIGLSLDAARSKGRVRVLCLSYDDEDKLLGHQDIATMGPNASRLARHFKPNRNAKSFNIALYVSAKGPAAEVALTQFGLVATKARRLRSMHPETVLERALEDT